MAFLTIRSSLMCSSFFGTIYGISFINQIQPSTYLGKRVFLTQDQLKIENKRLLRYFHYHEE